MALTSKSGHSAAAAPRVPRAQWEERSTYRVLEAHRDQILGRSRQIVEAAYELLEEKGLEGLTIRAVLKRTGLSRRAFYERFADKDELVLAVFEQTIQMATTRYSGQISTLTDPMERLKLIVMCLVLGKGSLQAIDGPESGRRAAAMSREHLRLAQSRPGDLQAALRPLLMMMAQQLSDGMGAGSVRRDDPQRLAALVYNLVSTTVHTELLTQKPPNWARRVQLATDTWEFCRRALAA
jgi:AcrR family transcriptional regulator